LSDRALQAGYAPRGRVMTPQSSIPFRPAVLAAAVALLSPSRAVAGPPFVTDDPEPVAYGHYEFYTLSTGTAVRGDTAGVAPAWEFNYGIIPNGQIHIIVPLAFDAPAGGPSQFGLGDTELGLKYRFIDEDKNGSRPMVGVYPLIELPSGNESLGLGAGNMRAYLPLWVQRSFGDWTTYGGGGYWINHGDGTLNRDYWFFGWLLQQQVTKQLAIGGEIFHQTAVTSTAARPPPVSTSVRSMISMNTTTCWCPRARACRMHPRRIFSPGMSAIKSQGHSCS